MRVVDAAAIDAALSWPSLIEALAAAFGGGLHAPPRHHHGMATPSGEATLLLMPAWSGPDAAEPVVGVKVVSVFPGNAGRDLPSVQGCYILSDGRTGVPLAVLDGARLTLWRTAATSALAARHLARADAARMVMVGTGALAPALVRAHRAVRPIGHLTVWGRRPESAERLAEELAREGVPAVAVTELEPAVREADVVSCATLSPTPLVRGDWLRPGAHLDLVGAYNLAMREADDDALARAAVYVDTPAALTEGGDVAVAIAGGAFHPDRVRGDLARLVSGRVPGRTDDREITLFKSIGAAIEDLAAAALVWRNLPPP